MIKADIQPSEKAFKWTRVGTWKDNKLMLGTKEYRNMKETNRLNPFIH
jgi:hypothetical protein